MRLTRALVLTLSVELGSLAVDVLELAFLQSSVAEGLGDSVDILVLKHQDLVYLEVAEAKFVERCKGFLESTISLLGNVLVVEHLWSLDGIGNSDLTLHEFVAARLVTWLEVSLDLLVESNLWHHLNWLLLWLHNQDVTPDLVPEFDVSSLHSEVSSVPSI